MFRWIMLALAVSLTFSYFIYSRDAAKAQTGVDNTVKLDGTYEFVSQSTVLTKPDKGSSTCMSPEWSGLWQFQNGYYTSVLMKRRREAAFFATKEREDFGFESSAGPYKIEGSNIRLTQTYTFHPFEVDDASLMKYSLDGDTLTLIRTLRPNVEDLREGTVTTVLRRMQ